MDFWQTLAENWVEILGALGTIAAVFLGTKMKGKTPEQKAAAKIQKQEKKCAADVQRLKKDNEKLEALKNASN